LKYGDIWEPLFRNNSTKVTCLKNEAFAFQTFSARFRLKLQKKKPFFLQRKSNSQNQIASFKPTHHNDRSYSVPVTSYVSRSLVFPR